ncbi:hypothetical protein [Nitratidesulfovibrio liaohensis]|uniref:Uncharacterized protein n=1 Tax=Nitratidesulfovibrio liaohensis TaxID=2604158 RepID=A0ABY9R5Y0_9BACT|nr:hypothetical protein [Nitratidesulfovibrio liaohensis]WMW66721.1 hypothetical protein KPS_001333 [Nitratidesulfovibrio liaohensis]
MSAGFGPNVITSAVQTSEVSICNKALRYLGAPEIVALDQPSREADLCSRYYAEARDELLEHHHWNFATRYTSLAPLAAVPPFGFACAYRLPGDCLRVRRLRGEPPFEVVEARTLYTDAAPAEAVLTVRVTDPARFPALFVEALARRLAAALAVPLMNSSRTEQAMLQRFGDALEAARVADAAEGASDPVEINPWLMAR